MSDNDELTVDNFKKALKKFITTKVLDTKEFNACFQGVTISQSRLHQLKNRVDETVRDAFSEEVDRVFEEAKMDEKLEILMSLNPSYDASWRPPGDSVSQLRTIRIKRIQKELQELQLLINVKSEKINNLKNQLLPFIQTIDSLMVQHEKLEKLCTSAEKSSSKSKETFDDLLTDLAECFEVLFN